MYYSRNGGLIVLEEQELIKITVVWLDGSTSNFVGIKNSDGDYGYDAVRFETPDGVFVDINKRQVKYITIQDYTGE